MPHPGRARAGTRSAPAHVLNAAYALHPERFVRTPPAPPKLPTAAWIDKPRKSPPLTTFEREASRLVPPGLSLRSARELMSATST
jgi:hypothetical protein